MEWMNCQPKHINYITYTKGKNIYDTYTYNKHLECAMPKRLKPPDICDNLTMCLFCLIVQCITYYQLTKVVHNQNRAEYFGQSIKLKLFLKPTFESQIWYYVSNIPFLTLCLMYLKLFVFCFWRMDYSLIAFDERVTFWLQRAQSLLCVFANFFFFSAHRLVYNLYAITHAYNAANAHAQGSDKACWSKKSYSWKAIWL